MPEADSRAHSSLCVAKQIRFALTDIPGLPRLKRDLGVVGYPWQGRSAAETTLGSKNAIAKKALTGSGRKPVSETGIAIQMPSSTQHPCGLDGGLSACVSMSVRMRVWFRCAGS